MHHLVLPTTAPLGRWQARLIWRSILASATALAVLALAGAQSEITLTVLPGVAGIVGLAVDEYNLHRTGSGQAPLAHGWCAAILGFSVLVVALVVFSAT